MKISLDAPGSVDDENRPHHWEFKELGREIHAYLGSHRIYPMTEHDIMAAYAPFQPPSHGDPGTVPRGAAVHRAKADFEAAHGAAKSRLERARAEAATGRDAASARCASLEKERATTPEWIDSEEAGVPKASWRRRWFSHFLLGCILAISTFAWVNTGTLGVEITQSWLRSLVYTAPLLVAPWFADLVLAFLTKRSETLRHWATSILVLGGIAAFGLFLHGYCVNILGNDPMKRFYTGRGTESPLMLQIAAQVVFEIAFGVLLIDKWIAVRRSLGTRNPKQQGLDRQLEEARRLFATAEAEQDAAARNSRAFESEQQRFADLVVAIVARKWEMRAEAHANRQGLDEVLDSMANSKSAASGGPPSNGAPPPRRPWVAPRENKPQQATQLEDQQS